MVAEDGGAGGAAGQATGEMSAKHSEAGGVKGASTKDLTGERPYSVWQE